MIAKPSLTAGEPPALVFVSSVMSEDMRPWRESAVSTLETLSDLQPWAFEFTPASSEDVDFAYLRKVRDAEFVLWLVGPTTTEPVRRELAEALRCHRRLLVFRLPAGQRDDATEALLKTVPKKWSPEIDALDDFARCLELTIRDEILRALRGKPGMASFAELESVVRESRGRCVAKWRLIGIDETIALELADDPTIPELPNALLDRTQTGVLILIAGMSAGKSLCAERWLQQQALDAITDAAGPLPVYIEARGAGPRLRDDVISATQSWGNVQDRGVSLVLDDLSRCSEPDAGRLLQQAWQLAYLWPRSRIVITSRPIAGLIANDHEDVVTLPLLTEKKGTALARLACGDAWSRAHPEKWSASVREAVRWPLFALLTGVYLRGKTIGKSHTYSDLLEHLIERSLMPAGAASAAGSHVLKRLAVLSVDTGRSLVPASEVGTRAEVQELLNSRLVEKQSNLIGLSLDILGEWLAGESLAEGEPDVDELLTDPARLYRWRYPLMAVIGSKDFETASAILGSLTHRWPAMASRLVSEETIEHSAGHEAIQLSNPLDIGMRIRYTMDCWIDGLWPAASLFAPLEDDGALCGLGVQIHETRLSTRWRRRGSGSPKVTTISADDAADWRNLHAAQPQPVSSWPWSWTLSEIQTRLRYRVESKRLPLGDSLLLSEVAYEAARAIVRQKGSIQKPVPIEAIEQWLSELDAMPGTIMTYTTGGMSISPDLLRMEVERRRRNGEAYLARPYPTPVPTSGDTWEWYGGDAGMRSAVTALLRATLSGYRVLVREAFPKLRKDLAHYVLQPAEVRVRLFRPKEAGFAGDMSLVLLPKKTTTRNTFAVSIGSADERWEWQSESLPAWAAEQVDRIARYRPDSAWWIQPVTHHHRIPLFKRTPASRLAFRWLHEDLFAVGLVDRPPRSFDLD